jgi:hypothetical protein
MVDKKFQKLLLQQSILRAHTMAEEQKDYTLATVVGVTALMILGVFAFKNLDVRNEHVAGKGFTAETTAQAEAAALAKHKDLNNDVLK